MTRLERAARELAAWALVLFVAVLAWLWIVAASTAAPRIEEDHPAWDCRTMGNRVCGVER